MATPQAVAVDNSGRLYVADDQNNRILIFNKAELKPNGANADIVLGRADFLTGTTNTGGISASTLSRPGGIFFDNAANVLWVADYANARAVRYSPVGGGLRWISTAAMPQPSTTPSPTASGPCSTSTAMGWSTR